MPIERQRESAPRRISAPTEEDLADAHDPVQLSAVACATPAPGCGAWPVSTPRDGTGRGAGPRSRARWPLLRPGCPP